MMSDSAGAGSPGSTDCITVVVIGPFPPPMHGMAYVTAIMTEQLRSRCNIHVNNISPGVLTRGLGYHLVKATRVCRAALSLLWNARAQDASLYLPADAGLGTYYTTLFIILARLFRYRNFIHHHNFVYIDKRVMRMALLARCAGSKAVHIFLCPRMERCYREHYPWARQYLLLSNAWNFSPADSPPARPDSFLVLGHLSNLGPEKGLYDVLDTLRAMIAREKRVRLVLAGPPTTPEVRKDIEAAIQEFGDALDYRGPAFGADKDKFYRDIDVFLFPSQNEGQPLVLFEAMSQGVPSICYARGCMADDLAEGGGFAAPVESSFVDYALPILIDWEGNPAALHEARIGSLARVHFLKAQASAELQTVVNHIAAKTQASRS